MTTSSPSLEQSDAEKAMLAWLAKADELMKDNEYWLYPSKQFVFDPESNEFYEFDAELNGLLLKQQQK